MDIKHRFTGKVLFSFEGSVKAATEAAPRKDANLWGADLRGADLRGANLRGADLRGADLQSADLRGADLQSADLRGTDLQGADLWGADLQDADLRGADLQSADLRGAVLQGADLIDAGQDARGYRFVAVLQADVAFRITAGCRWLTMDEARKHWASRHEGALHAEIQGKLKLICDVAEARGWTAGEEAE